LEFRALSRRESSAQKSTEHEVRITTTSVSGSELSGGTALYGTPSTKMSRHPRLSTSKSTPLDFERRLRSSCRPSNVDDVDLSARSPAASHHLTDDQRRLEMTVRERDVELSELRQTLELNEKALLRSLDDERRRWAAERQRLETELFSASRRHLSTLPVSSASSAFHSPSINHDPVSSPPGERPHSAAVVVVGPIQRPLSNTLDSGVADVSAKNVDACFNSVANCDTVTSYPSGVVGDKRGNICSNAINNDVFSADRPKSSGEEFDVEKLKEKLEQCRQEFADERRRWADEKRVVVEYQLRLQAYCRQLADRNQLLEEQLKAMSSEPSRNGGSSGYSSDSAALVVQFLDDSNLLTSSL